MMKRFVTAGVLLLLLLPQVAGAQQRVQRFNDAQASLEMKRLPGLGGPWRPLRIAKWTALLAGTASAGYGFSANRTADEEYAEIEAICVATPLRCAGGASGPYADAALEAQYQDVRSLDRRSRLALIGGQVTLVSSVILFILDLREDNSPPNVPYDPNRLRLLPGPGTLELRLPTR